MADLENPKCKKYFDKFLSLDKNEIIPLDVSFHLLTCAKCRTAVRSMSAAERLLQRQMKKSEPRANGSQGGGAKGQNALDGQRAYRHESDPVVEAALRQIAEAGLAYPQMPVPGRVSLKKWVVCGAGLVVCLAAFPFTALGNWASAVFGIRFLVSFYVVMGLSVAAYVAIFIGSNLDFFVKRIEAAKNGRPEKAGKAP